MSERVFSSSKETDALRRAGLDGAMMEILQMLKFSLKQRLRECTPAQFITVEEDLQESLVTTQDSDVAQLIHSGRLEQLLNSLP